MAPISPILASCMISSSIGRGELVPFLGLISFNSTSSSGVDSFGGAVEDFPDRNEDEVGFCTILLWKSPDVLEEDMASDKEL